MPEDKQSVPVSRIGFRARCIDRLEFASSDAYIQQIVIDQTATLNFTPIILGTSPRHLIRSTRVAYLVKSSQMILTTGSSQISTLRPRIRAGLNTLLTLRLSHRALQHSAADS